MIKLLICLIGISTISFAGNTPNDQEGSAFEQKIRAFYKADDFHFLFEVKMAEEKERDSKQSFRIGAKYRLHPNLKVGLYYNRAFAKRHEEDWGKNPTWGWQNTKNRGENELIFELSPRMTITSTIIGELRTQLVYNEFNKNQTLKLRPGLTYFIFNKGKPFLNLYFQYELYNSLNFSENITYERWGYIGSLYHVSKSFLIGPYIARRKVRWANTEDFKKITGKSYQIESNTFVLGLASNFYF